MTLYYILICIFIHYISLSPSPKNINSLRVEDYYFVHYYNTSTQKKAFLLIISMNKLMNAQLRYLFIFRLLKNIEHKTVDLS